MRAEHLVIIPGHDTLSQYFFDIVHGVHMY